MPLKTIEDRLRDIVVEQLGVEPEEVTADATFVEDFGVDAIDAIEITMAVEEEFNVVVTDEEFEECERFGRLVEIVERKAKAVIRK